MRQFSLVILVCLFCACHKNDPAPKEEEAVAPVSFIDAHSEPFQFINSAQGPANCGNVSYIYNQGYNYYAPSVNPNNALQFCCRRVRQQQSASQLGDLIVYDFTTDRAKFICDQVKGEPHWGAKDWIIFTRGGDHTEIWKIKPNGDSLTLVLSANSPTGARWSPDAKRFVYFCTVCGVNKMSDEQGIVLKSFTFTMTAWGWKSDNEILFVSTDGAKPQFATYNLTTESLQHFDLLNNVEAVTWNYLPKTNEIFWCSDALYRSTLGASLATKLKSFTTVESQSFADINTFPSVGGDRIFTTRTTSTKMQNETCQYSLKSDISIMNIDGTNERRVVIPE